MCESGYKSWKYSWNLKTKGYGEARNVLLKNMKSFKKYCESFKTIKFTQEVYENEIDECVKESDASKKVDASGFNKDIAYKLCKCCVEAKCYTNNAVQHHYYIPK